MRFSQVARYPITINGETVLIGTANELAVALDVLQGQYDREALVQLRPHLTGPHLCGIIAHADGFKAVMKALAPDDQLYLIQAIGPGLVAVMQNADHLRDQLAAISYLEVEEALLKALDTEGLHSLILTAEELAEALGWVYGECDALMLELLGLDYVRRLCRQASDLSAILRGLDKTLQEYLVEQLGWTFVTSLIRDVHDLAYLLRALPVASSERLLQHYSGSQLKELIGNVHDWTYLYQRLEPAEADFLSNLLA